MKSGRFESYPQALRAVSTTNSSFRHCSSSVRRLPAAVEANPHWGLRDRFSVGTYWDASSMQRSKSSWHSSFPGWQLRECSSSYYPWGPDQVWIDITAYFYNAPTQVEYTQYAKFTAAPNGQSATCTLLTGSLPWFWSQDCESGLYY